MGMAAYRRIKRDDDMDIIFNYLQQKIVESAGSILTGLSSVSIDIFSNSVVINLLNFMDYVGYMLLAVGILFAISNMYIQYVEDGTSQVHLLIVNIINSIVVIIFLQAGTIAMFNISTIIQNAMKSFITVPDFNDVVGTISSVGSDSLNVVWAFIVDIVALIAIIVVLVQCTKRAGIYLIQIMVGYLYIFSIPAGNTDGFFGWCRQTVAIAFTNAVQITLLMLGMKLMTNTLQSIFLGIGVILAASSVEKVAGQFGMSANSRQSIGAAVRTVRETTQLIHTIKKAV